MPFKCGFLGAFWGSLCDRGDELGGHPNRRLFTHNTWVMFSRTRGQEQAAGNVGKDQMWFACHCLAAAALMQGSLHPELFQGGTKREEFSS